MTGVLALVAGGSLGRAVWLAAAMVGFQVSIGAVNDLVDERDDAAAKPAKPLPAGLVSRRGAAAVAVAGGGLGLVLAGSISPSVLLVGLAGYGLGLAYDLGLKRGAWAWLAFALALPLVPAFAWLGAVGSWPPRYPLLVALGLLAGLSLALANGLVDLEADRASGSRGIAVRLGRTRGLAVMAACGAVVVAIAALTALSGPGVSAASLVAIAAGAVFLAVGWVRSVGMSARARELGWEVQALGVGLLAVGWFAAQVP